MSTIKCYCKEKNTVRHSAPFAGMAAAYARHEPKRDGEPTPEWLQVMWFGKPIPAELWAELSCSGGPGSVDFPQSKITETYPTIYF